jgi:TonB family protein
MLLPVVVLFLIYPNHAAAQQDKQEPPAAFDGRGFPSDPEVLKNMAEQGLIYGQFSLGSMYADGRGVTQDYIQAYMWLTVSVEGYTNKRSLDLQKAADLRDSLAKKMTPQQIEEAERLAKEWVSKYVQRMGAGPFDSRFWGMTAPIVSAKRMPPYTEKARKAGISGVIPILIIVRKDGTVASCKILRGLGYGLDESTISTITTKWRFKPGTFKGNPVDCQLLMEVSFRLY